MVEIRKGGGKMKRVFMSISRVVGWVLRLIVPDLYDSRDVSLKELEQITSKVGDSWLVKQTNDSLALLNKNIINLNCSTAVYSRVLLIVAFFTLVLTLVMLIKQ